MAASCLEHSRRTVKFHVYSLDPMTRTIVLGLAALEPPNPHSIMTLSPPVSFYYRGERVNFVLGMILRQLLI